MKIMVIDDKSDQLKTLVGILRGFAPPSRAVCEVSGYRDYKKALRVIDKMPFDVVVTDMRMGSTKREGLEVVKHLSNMSAIVIVLTAYPSIPNCVEAIKAGAWDYLEKDPIDGQDPYARLYASLTEALKFRKAHPRRGAPNPDDVWIRANIKNLMRKFPGKLVAVVYSKVVDCDDSYAKLSARVRKKFSLTTPAIVSIPDAGHEKAL